MLLCFARNTTYRIFNFTHVSEKIGAVGIVVAAAISGSALKLSLLMIAFSSSTLAKMIMISDLS